MSLVIMVCSFCLGAIVLRFLHFLGLVKATRRLQAGLVRVILLYALLVLAWKNYHLSQNIQDYVLMAELSRDAALETESLSAAMELDLEDSQDQLREALAEIACLRRQAVEGGRNGEDTDETHYDGGSGDVSTRTSESGGSFGVLKWLVGALGSDEGTSGGSKGGDTVCAYRGSQDALKALERHPKYRQLRYLLQRGSPDRSRQDHLRRDLSVAFHPDKNRGCAAHVLTEVNARINSFRAVTSTV